jgi:hypothetical protein
LNGVTSTALISDIDIVLSLANTNFAINPGSDSITIGAFSISGANLSSLNITGSGGTFTIPSTYFSSAVQTTTGPTSVSVNLTTNRGQYNATTTSSLSTRPYSPFNVVFSANWPNTNIPFFNKNQTFNWNSVVTGTIASGNLRYTQVGNNANTGLLSTTGATSGTSISLDSSNSFTISTTDYVGLGANVTQGTSTVSTSITLNAATVYTPLFYKITNSSANPNFTTSDTYLTKAFALGDGANTSATPANYLWLAVPGTQTLRTFQHNDQGFTVVDTPAVTYTNQTIGGQTYQVYGFNNFNASLRINVTS